MTLAIFSSPSEILILSTTVSMAGNVLRIFSAGTPDLERGVTLRIERLRRGHAAGHPEQDAGIGGRLGMLDAVGGPQSRLRRGQGGHTRRSGAANKIATIHFSRHGKILPIATISKRLPGARISSTRTSESPTMLYPPVDPHSKQWTVLYPIETPPGQTVRHSKTLATKKTEPKQKSTKCAKCVTWSLSYSFFRALRELLLIGIR